MINTRIGNCSAYLIEYSIGGAGLNVKFIIYLMKVAYCCLEFLENILEIKTIKLYGV